jgi:hypothetical protein
MKTRDRSKRKCRGLRGDADICLSILSHSVPVLCERVTMLVDMGIFAGGTE